MEFGTGDCVVFEVELCGCSGSLGTTVHLSFYGVKNIGEVRSFVDAILEQAKGRAQVAEIIGILRVNDRRFLMDLDRGPLYINAKGFTET